MSEPAVEKHTEETVFGFQIIKENGLAILEGQARQGDNILWRFRPNTGCDKADVPFDDFVKVLGAMLLLYIELLDEQKTPISANRFHTTYDDTSHTVTGTLDDTPVFSFRPDFGFKCHAPVQLQFPELVFVMDLWRVSYLKRAVH